MRERPLTEPPQGKKMPRHAFCVAARCVALCEGLGLSPAAVRLVKLLVELIAEESTFGNGPTFLGEAQNAVTLVARSVGCAECVVVADEGLACAFHLCKCGCGHRSFVCKDKTIEGTLQRLAEKHAAAEEDDEEEGGVDDGDEEARLNSPSHVWGKSDNGSNAEENGNNAPDDEYDGSDDERAEHRRHLVGRRALDVFEAQLSVLSRVGNHAGDGFVFVVVVKHGCGLEVGEFLDVCASLVLCVGEAHTMGL